MCQLHTIQKKRKSNAIKMFKKDCNLTCVTSVGAEILASLVIVDKLTSSKVAILLVNNDHVTIYIY